jgi:hypothetical protein
MIKKYLDKIVAIAAIVLAIVSLCMIFAPAAVCTDLDSSFTGANLIFGYSKTEKVLVTTTTVDYFSFSANFITFILLIVGIVALVLALLGIFKKITVIVAFATLLVAGIFYFLMLQLCVPSDVTKLVFDQYSLGAGAIVGGIFAILSALASASLLFIKTK